MLMLEPTTRLDLHRVARASLAVYTSEMADFLIALPVDLKAASEDEIEAFDELLDKTEEKA